MRAVRQALKSYECRSPGDRKHGMFAANAVGGTVPANAPTLRLRSQDVADIQRVEMQLGTVR